MKKPLLIFLFIVFYAGYLVFTKLLFGDDNLVIIKGKLPKYFQLVETEVEKENGLSISYLIFRLNQDDRLYTLKADVTNAPEGPRLFDGVAHALKEANEIKVYIRRADLGVEKPKVYQIKTDEKQVFNLIKKPAKNSNLYLYLLLLVLLFCAAYYWLQCLSIPKKKPICKRWAYKIHRTNVNRHYGF